MKNFGMGLVYFFLSPLLLCLLLVFALYGLGIWLFSLAKGATRFFKGLPFFAPLPEDLKVKEVKRGQLEKQMPKDEKPEATTPTPTVTYIQQNYYQQAPTGPTQPFIPPQGTTIPPQPAEFSPLPPQMSETSEATVVEIAPQEDPLAIEGGKDYE